MEKEYLGNLGVDGRIITKCILEKQVPKIPSGVNRLKSIE
jgi:hypothetical protein